MLRIWEQDKIHGVRRGLRRLLFLREPAGSVTEKQPLHDALVTFLLWAIIISLAIVPFLRVGALPSPGVKEGNFTKRTTTGSQSVTGLGFKPRAVIFTWTLLSGVSPLTGNSGNSIGKGFATGSSNERALSTWDASQSIISNSAAGRATYNNASVVFQNTTNGTVVAVADLTSMDNDGFTLNWSLMTDAAAHTIHYYAISEEIATNATVNTFSLTTGTGNLSVTNAGFQPNFVMMMTGGTTSHGSNTNELTYSLGVATNSTDEWAVAGRSDHAVGTGDTCSNQRTNAVIAYIGSLVNCATFSEDAYADFTQFTASGFDINKSNAPAAIMDVFYLAISGPSFKVGNFNKPTAPASQTVTGVGFQPTGVSFASWGLVADNVNVDPQSNLSLGSSSGFGAQGAVSKSSLDGNSTTSPGMRSTTGSTISTIETDAETTTGDASLTSLNNDGFTLNWSVADITADQYLYWAVGPAGVYPKLSQTGYIWENDDKNDSNFDENTQQAAGSASIASVRKGERLTLRTQVKNTGTAALRNDLALFYDRGDGIFSKVSSNKSASTTAGNCTDTNFDCVTVDNTGTNTGSYTSTAIGTRGTQWVSFYDTTNTSLRVAMSVGSGGNCNSGAWQCYTVDDQVGDDTGKFSSIAIDTTGKPWISYYDDTLDQLMVAQFVGTSGSGCIASTAWTCEAVDNSGTNTGSYTSIALDNNNIPWVSFYDTTNTSLRLATRGGGFGATGSGCGTNWTCGVVDNDTDDTGQFSSLAFSPSNNPYISYYDVTGSQLMVAQFVGGTAGGSCGLGGGSTAFLCEPVDDLPGAATGQYSSIAFAPDGVPWVSYYDSTNFNLRTATRSSALTTACTDTDWTCIAVDSTGTVGLHTSIAFAPNGAPWISYMDDDATATNKALKQAHFVTSSGTGCAVSSWACSKVDSVGADTVGEFTSLAFGPDGVASISYYDGGTETALKVATVKRNGEIVASPGLASSSTGTVSVDDSTIARWTGNPANNVDITSASFTPAAGTVLVVAVNADTSASADITTSVSSSPALTWTNRSERDWGSGATNGHTSIWTATVSSSASTTVSVRRTVGTGGTTNRISAKAYIVSGADTASPVGQVGSGASTTNNLTAAAYTSSVNNSRGIGAATDWTQQGVPTSTDVGDGAHYVGQLAVLSAYKAASTPLSGTAVTLNFDAAGAGAPQWGWVAIELKPSTMATQILESHADMSTVTDTFNRDNANCIGTGTWNNGKWSEAEQIASLTLPAGSGTAQCTEVAFMLDTSQAMPNTTYRFVVASEDAFRFDKGSWRGPTSVTAYATLTTESATTVKVSKDALPAFAACTGSGWGCVTIDGLGATAADGQYSGTAFDAHGTPWISYFDATNTAVKVARYVGSGGNCTSGMWQCEIVDTLAANAADGSFTSIAFDPNGAPLISYFDGGNTAIKVARYVGTGGNCTSTAWTCETVDTMVTNANDGRYGQIAVSPNGAIWLSYQDGTNTALKVARHIGKGGNCTSTAWTCETVDTIGTNAADGQYTSIAFGSDDAPWVSYFDGTNTAVKVAHFVAGSGSGCTSVGWNCETVDTLGINAGDGQYSEITVDGSDKPWVSYRDGAGMAVKVATRGGTFTGAGACTDADWTCAIVDGLGSTAADGSYTAIAIDPQGQPTISYNDATNTAVKVARYVGTGGNCTSGAWNCLIVDTIVTSANDGIYTSLAFDNSGVAWVSYQDGTNWYQNC